jgi:hypothetical protein
LFLKPKDAVEFRNYQVISRLAPALQASMPKIYGEIEISGKPYVVMENVRFGSEGEALEQLVDIKLAGKLEAKDFSPIVSQEEMVATRGRKKNFADAAQMKLTASLSPDYMIAYGKFRAVNYPKSEQTLMSTLESTKIEHILHLIRKLTEMQTCMVELPIGLIGSSIILVRQQDGSIKPLLIDPAHMAVCVSQEGLVRETLDATEDAGIYFDTDRTKLQKASNIPLMNEKSA